MRGATSLPSISIVPEVSVTTPAITLVSVDLPAPFSPTRAWISPSRKSKSTSSIAGTPAYLLVARRSSRIGAIIAVIPSFHSSDGKPQDLAGTLGEDKEPTAALDRRDNTVMRPSTRLWSE